MRDIVLYDGKRILIIELSDLTDSSHLHNHALERLFQVSRALYQTILVLVSPGLGLSGLPKWLRHYALQGLLRRKEGDFNSYYIMELGPDLTWIKEGWG